MNSDSIQNKTSNNFFSDNHVLIIEDENSLHTIMLEESEYSIGRDPRNKIALSSKKISRFHATLRKRSDVRNKSFSFWILDGDLHGGRSTNGIYINGKRCLVQELKHGDIISIGYEVQARYYIVSNLNEIEELQRKDLDREDVIRKSLASLSNQKSNRVQNTQELNYPSVVPKTQVFSDENQNIESVDGGLDKLASFPELSPNPIIEIDWVGNITYVNPSASKKFPELKTMTVINNHHPLFLGLLEGIKNYGKNNNLFVREVQFKNQILEQYIHYLQEQKLIRSYIFDFTKRSKVFDTQINENEQRYKSVIEKTKNGILLVDLESYKILEANNAICDFLGYSINDIYGYSLRDIIDIPQDDDFWQTSLPKLIKQEQEYLRESIAYRSKENHIVSLDSDINIINYGDQKIIFFDVHALNTGAISSGDIDQQNILYDLETGLPNRQFFIEQLNIAVSNSHRHSNLLCILMIELEFLHDDQEPMSYAVKLSILEGFAKRLRSCFRLGDTVAKWEQNQFIVMLPYLSAVRDAGKISQRILQTVKPPFDIETSQIYTKTSIGITLQQNELKKAETLFKELNQALEKSKSTGGNNYQFFHIETQQEIEELLNLEKLLEHALDLQELRLEYQPQANINKKAITGVEALIRWHHPELGKMSPEQFIPLAQETGLIIPMGEWILKTACQQLKNWQENGVMNAQPISVNISTQQLKQRNFVNMVTDILAETQLEPQLLELEIKEDTILAEPKLAKESIDKLTDLGVKVSLDDFGTDLIALGLLTKYKFYRIKIARSIINNLTSDSLEEKIISLIVEIAQKNGSEIVVKGVETQEQLDLLVPLKSQEFQGILLTSPLSQKDITEFLTNPKYDYHLPELDSQNSHEEIVDNDQNDESNNDSD